MVWTSGVVAWENMTPGQKEAAYYAWGRKDRSPDYKTLFGNLTYKLDPLQLETYGLIDEYLSQCKTSFERIWINEWSRRLGKDFMTWVIFREHSRVVRDDILYYGTAYEKQINEILLPIVKIVDKDCPPEWRLKHRRSESHLYDPETGTEIRLIGLDVNPDGIRGNRAGKICITETSYVEKIEDAETAYKPMLVEDPNIERFYNSTPGKMVAHKWHTVIVPRAKKTGGFSHHVLEDCPRFTKEQIDAAYGEPGWERGSTKSDREYQCIHVGEESVMVIPEAAKALKDICVDDYPRPLYAAAYDGMDPGMVDLTGIVWAYHDFKNDILVFEKAWCEPRKNTDEIAKVLEDSERELWENWQYFKEGYLHSNPKKRVCDRDLRLIADLEAFYELTFTPTAKQDLQAAINAFRIRVQQRKIRILPGAKDLAIHMEAAIWNKSKTKLEHVSDDLGHFDVLMAAVYLNRNVDVTFNPFPDFKAKGESYHVPHPQTQNSGGWSYRRTRHGGIIQ